MKFKTLSQRLRPWLHRSKIKSSLKDIEHILSKDSQPVTARAEGCFEVLQSSYQPLPEYGYDPASIFRRATHRISNLLMFDELGKPGAKGLDVGAGDGMLSVLLQVFGHNMTLVDIDDWRVNSAKDLNLIKANCCDQLPFDGEVFDFIVSFNAFEHFPNPSQAFEEFFRVLRRGGLMHFHFNPLYCSPWGLHAYRMFRMPYPQFLFSDHFTKSKLSQIGIWDLGKQSTDLQPLNQWRPSQFEALWQRSDVQILAHDFEIDDNYLHVIQEFPECFQGRSLKIDDLIKSGIAVTLQKK
jgi:2-polyprenyl-3-methyl-5-hydroxy-6-metoxy-1,4-benzoquinol methylase